MSKEIVKKTIELVESVGNIRDNYLKVASVNEQFTQGNQWGNIYFKNDRIAIDRDIWFDDEQLPRAVIDLLENKLNTWASLITKDRITGKAVPATDEPLDLYKATLAQKIIEFVHKEENTADLLHQMVRRAGIAGTAGIKAWYDVKKRKLSTAVLDINNYYIDLKPDYREAKWVIFDSLMEQEDAEEIFEELKIKKQPQLVTVRNGAGEDVSGVRLYELWLRPNREYPDGLFAVILDDVVIEQTIYPLVTQNDSGEPEYPLPLVLFKVKEIRDSAYGQTTLTKCVPLQRIYNETFNRIVKRVRSTQTHLFVPRQLEGWDPQVDTMVQYDPEQFSGSGSNLIGYTQPPGVPIELFNFLQIIQKAINDVFGINEVSDGTETKSLSGRAIENLATLDAQKNADTFKSFEKCVKEFYRLCLIIVITKYDPMRQIKITNGTLSEVILLNDADIQGVDIAIETGSELETTSDMKDNIAAEKRKAGLINDNDWRKVLDKPGYGMSKEISKQIIENYLEIGILDMLPDDVNPEILLGMISKYKQIALSEGRKQIWIMLERLRREVVEQFDKAMELRAKQQPPQPQQVPQKSQEVTANNTLRLG